MMLFVLLSINIAYAQNQTVPEGWALYESDHEAQVISQPTILNKSYNTVKNMIEPYLKYILAGFGILIFLIELIHLTYKKPKKKRKSRI